MSPHLSRTRTRLALWLAPLLLLVAACGDFSAEAVPYSVQPSLTPAVVTPVVPDPPTPGQSTSSSSSSSTSSAPPDPCVPTDPAVIAACLDAPWGLVPLDGQSALVGERTTGRILLVAYQQTPVEIATVPDVDASGDGGLLGLAVSPSYAEDGLIYAYVTTKTDNRIVRIAPGDTPKAIFTGIPRGAEHNGGPITFVDRFLYVATGDAGDPTAAGSDSSLAGKVLRLDEFGKPTGGTLTPGSPVFATGLTQPTGMCVLATGNLGVMDHRKAQDLLLSVSAGHDYSQPKSGDSAWSWTKAEGGANDCAFDQGILAATSLAGKQVVGLEMTEQGTFTGDPAQLLGDKYGRLLTVEPGPESLFWITTSNKDGAGDPTPSDDRVIVLPNSGGGGGGGPD
ncbi:glucose dehydrogenase [Nakamurella sp. YIM 132087]|uniref:Glucose dehydrogenase n=1 Tax=Nakamurella alba TaxID=2665158 RepID=A0A7K1FG43_9ACTN|nr:PQQ-dependent sugar dehydrogenase [Nakamurella alba]MTD13085.1 glucose dehydrogenase [Nakamurella alba]